MDEPHRFRQLFRPGDARNAPFFDHGTLFEKFTADCLCSGYNVFSDHEWMMTIGRGRRRRIRPFVWTRVVTHGAGCIQTSTK